MINNLTEFAHSLKTSIKFTALRYAFYFLSAIVIVVMGFILLSIHSTSYIQYNGSKSLAVGFYFMEPCTGPVIKHSLVTYDQEMPKWVDHETWITRNMKRVSGLPTDFISVNDEKTTITLCSDSGQCLSLPRHGHLPIDETMLGVIPEGHFFAAGDHRDSLDSRYYGLIDNNRIISCASFLF
jgi:type IV secretory pathway protease TraF